MKVIFILFLALLITLPPAFGIPLAEKTGLKFSFPVNVDDSVFFIEGTANFDVKSLNFDKITKEVNLKIESSLEDNLMEIVIPKKVISTQPIFLVDGVQVIHKLEEGYTNSFTVIEFNGTGTHDITISESAYQYTQNVDDANDETAESNGGGCLIATAAFGSELASQIQFLRELRDNTVLQTQSGTTFMTTFNQFYYSFSPVVADYERENPVFKEAVKLSLTPLLASLTLLNHVDIDTEQEMLGYGIGVIMLNIGMYFMVPAIAIVAIKKKFHD